MEILNTYNLVLYGNLELLLTVVILETLMAYTFKGPCPVQILHF